MAYNDLIEMGLNGVEPLKIIMCGRVDASGNEKVGVVEVVYISMDKEAVKKKIEAFSKQYPDNYYMVYSVPLDTDLTTLNHYPSISIEKSDLVDW